MDHTLAYRKKFRDEVIPKKYSGVLHAVINFSPLAATAIIALVRVEDLHVLELLIVPMMLFVGNFVVYVIHKYPLHRPGLNKYAYNAHTIQHHRFYTHEHPSYDTPKDFFMIFFPTWVMYVFAGLYLGPVSWFLPRIISNNYAQLFIFMSAVYFVLYETVHLISHLPIGHFLHRLPWLGYMREFHIAHHNPKLMSKYNFGIVFPFWDWILRTHYKKTK